jgi:hypothetical protein
LNKGLTLFITFISLIIGLQGSLYSQQSNKPDAKIVFEEEEFDFGKVQKGAKLTHTFKFKNSGTDTLFIKKIHSS